MIHLIVQRGLVDERVLRVLERTGILHHSVSLSGEMVEEIDAAIKAAALGREEAAWGRAGEAAAAIAEVGELAQLELPLSEALAWTSQLAQKRWESLVRTPALPPYPVVVRTDKESALRHLEPGEKGGEDKRKKGMAVEAAMSDWMWAMKAAGVYRLWFDRKARMVSLRYRSADRRVGAATELTPVPLDEDLIPRPWKRSVGFRVFRCDLTNPPQREWTDSNGEKRVLYFLDHGSPLHESLVGGWLHELQGRGEADPEKLTYAFQIKDVEQHGLGEVDGHLLCAKVAVIHPRLELDPVDTLYGENGVEYEADVRFLQQQLPPRLLLTGYSAGPAGGVTALSEPILHALLAPQVRAGRLVEVGDVNRLPQSFANRVEQLLGKAADKLKVEAREGWSPRLPAARVAVAERTWQLRVEAANELELLLAKQALVEGDLRELNAALKGDDSLRKKLRPMQVRRARECAELEAAEVSTRERLVARREALTEALRRATSPTVVSICQVVVVVGKVS